MSKQDRQGVRTAADLERKYNFDKTFAELMGIATDARDKVDSVESTLRDEIRDTATSIARDTERIVMAASENYTKKDEFEEFKESYESEFELTAQQISMNFETTSELIQEVDGKTERIYEDLEKHFEFTVDGLIIKAGAGSMQLLLDNDMIYFMKGDQVFGFWDGVNFHTGNIFVAVDEVAQFGNYGFVPYDDGISDGLDLVRIGENRDENSSGDSTGGSGDSTGSDAIVITKQPPAKTTAKLLQTTTLYVIATGTGLTYQWQVAMSADGSFSNMSGNTSNNLSLSSSQAMTRFYRCRIKDNNGNTVYSDVAQVTFESLT